MPRAEKGTPKDVANRMKSKGLQRLRWYCQVCQKQCRDENGFKCHTMSEAHLRQMLVVGESAGRHINEFSENFKHDFLALLSRRWGTKRVRANQVYQEYITDKNHYHMNATRWVTLTEFVKWLGREGIVHADETEKGWYISWIDNTPKALSRQAAHQAKERADMDEEQRMRKLIEEQIAKAQQEELERGEGGSGENPQEKEKQRVLQREQGAMPITLILGATLKKDPPPPTLSTSGPSGESSEAGAAAPTSALTHAPTGVPTTAPKPNPLKVNPLKRPAPSASNPLKAKVNPLKAASPTSGSASAAATPKPRAQMSELERIMEEDKERQKRREAQTWSGRGGHGSEGLQVKKQRVM